MSFTVTMLEQSNKVNQVSKTAHDVPNLYDKKTKVNQRLSKVSEQVSFLPVAKI